jgi:hypothetical protein
MKAILLIPFLFFCVISKGQSKNYSQFINEQSINEKQIVKTKGEKDEITYLGTVKDNKGKILFFVLSVYSEIQAAINIHAHANVIFLDKNKVLRKQFELGFRDELPFKLKNNSLYFHCLNLKTGNKEQYSNKLSTQIPEFLCVSPNECY